MAGDLLTRLVAHVLVCMSVLHAGEAQILTPDVDIDCSRSDTMLACSYRLLASSSPVSIVATSANRTLTIGTSKSYPSADSVTAVLFLIDTSDPGRQDVIYRNALQIEQILARAGTHHRFGLAHFDHDLVVNAPVGGNVNEIISSAKELQAVGMTTELYRNTLRAIELIGRTHADRKVIYLMSDGQAEDKAYFHTDVVRAARKHGVIINSLGYPRSIPLSVALQTLRRLSEETGGIYIETGMDFELPDTFVQAPFANIDRGGQFVIELGPLTTAALQPSVVNVRFETATTNLDVPVPVPLQPTSTLPPVSAQSPGPIAAAPTVVEIVPNVSVGEMTRLDKLLWYGIPATLVLLSVLTLVTLLLLYRRQVTPAASVTPGPNRPVAYLVRQDEPGKRFPVTSATCRIGRSRNNDMIIDDNSVSRRHAEIRRTFDGEFMLYDRE